MNEAIKSPIHDLPFYTLTDAEKRLDRNSNIYCLVTFGASAVLTVIGCLFGGKLLQINPVLGFIGIPVLTAMILICVTSGVHKLGADYREKINKPHAMAASKWLKERYGLSFEWEDTRTIIYGGSFTIDSPKVTETGDTKRYGTLSLPAYSSGIQFIQDATNGYRLIDLGNGQELPVLTSR